jgi:hypothetical protein
MGRKKKEVAAQEPQTQAPATETQETEPATEGSEHDCPTCKHQTKGEAPVAEVCADCITGNSDGWEARTDVTKPLKLKRPEGDIADGAALFEPDENGEYNSLALVHDEFASEDPEDLFTEICYAELENGKWFSAARAKSDSMDKVFLAEPLAAKEQHDCEAFAVIAALHRLTLALEPHKEDEAVKAVIGEIGKTALDWKLKADAFAATHPQTAEAAKSAEQKPEEPAAATEEKAEAAPYVQRVTRSLTRPFSAEEKDERNKELYDLSDEEEKLEQEKADLSKSYGNRIKGVHEKFLEKKALLRAGVTEVDVECAWRLNDPRPGKKQLYRLDTNKPLGEIEDIKNSDLEQPLALDPKAEAVAEEPKAAHPGDNGDTFLTEEGVSFPCEQFDANRNPKEYAICKGQVVEFSEADTIAKLKLPNSAAIAAIARVPGEQGAPATYRLRVFEDAKDRVIKAKADIEAASKLASAKVDAQPEGIALKDGTKPNSVGVYEKEKATLSYVSGKAKASIYTAELSNGMWISSYETEDGNGGQTLPLRADDLYDSEAGAILAAISEVRASLRCYKPSKDIDKILKALSADEEMQLGKLKALVVDSVQEPNTPEQETKPSVLTEEDKAKGPAWCCTKCGFTMGEAEEVLRREGKLCFTRGLHVQPLAVKYLLDNIEQVERWILDLRKAAAAKKNSAA